MPQLHLETRLMLPARDAHALATADGRLAEWLPGARSVSTPSDSPGVTVVAFGDGSRFRTRVTESTPGERFSRRWAHASGLWGTSRWTFRTEGDGTRLIVDVFWVLPAARGDAADPLTRGLLERHFANEIEHFRVWAETRGRARTPPRAA